MKRLFIIVIPILAVFASCKKDNKPSLAVISTSAATSITASGAIVGGTITNAGGSVITQSGICYALTNNPSLSDSVISGGPLAAGPFSITMSNLNANTAYYYRTYVINGIGTTLGGIDSFVTLQGAPTVTTTAISNNTDLTALSGGAVTNNGGSAITVTGICWATTTNPTISNLKTSDSVPSNSFSDTLTNLTVGTTYYVRAYATNSNGTGYGNQITFTASSNGTVTDIDGNIYGTVIIGTQTWTASNLMVRHYRNGDPIVDGFTGFDLDTTLSTGAYTFPNMDTTQAAAFGLYYNFGAIYDIRNIAPVGWHVPTDDDWYTLEFYEGLTASDTMANPGDVGLRGTIGGNLLVGGSSGLNLQLAGYYCPQCGGYSAFNMYGVYLSSSTVPGAESVWFRAFNVGGPGPIYRAYSTYIGSVRLIKD
jgi:uncharacterized protein (TIGR02145 family)